jgi:hypothetical protein
MTEAVTPPVKSGGSTTPAITEGVQARLRHLRDAISAFSADLREMERLEKSLLAAVDRLDRHSHLIGGETQLLEQLLKRDTSKPPVAKATSVVAIVDRVEADLATFSAAVRTEKAG